MEAVVPIDVAENLLLFSVQTHLRKCERNPVKNWPLTQTTPIYDSRFVDISFLISLTGFSLLTLLNWVRAVDEEPIMPNFDLSTCTVSSGEKPHVNRSREMSKRYCSFWGELAFCSPTDGFLTKPHTTPPNHTPRDPHPRMSYTRKANLWNATFWMAQYDGNTITTNSFQRSRKIVEEAIENFISTCLM